MARGYFATAVLVLGCATTPSAATPPPAAADEASAQERDDGLVSISGRLRAHDGSALRMGEVTVTRNGFIEPSARVDLDRDGRFHLDVSPGAYSIVVSAVDHAAVRQQAVVTDELHIDGSLGTYERKTPGESIRVRTELLDATPEVLSGGPGEAKRISEGVYRIELVARPPTATRLRYQLYSGGVSFNGPVADNYKSDDGGDYWSIVELGERSFVDLDLGKLPPAGIAPKLEWRGEAETTRALRAFVVRYDAEIRRWFDELPRIDGKIGDPGEADHAKLAMIAGTASAEVDATKDERARVLLRAAYLTTFVPHLAREADASMHRESMQWIVDNLPAGDLHLAMLHNLDNEVFRGLRAGDEKLRALIETWLGRIAHDNPDPGTAVNALRMLLHEADLRRDDARVRELYARSRDQRFTGTYVRQFIADQFDPERPLQRGKALPTFEFAALDGDGKITSSDREGKVYLLEFWATWCGPCVADMPKLHDVYAAINDARPRRRSKDGSLRKLAPAKHPKVEFVFVSFDVDRKAVASFRRDHWSMPWTHAFVGNDGSDREVMKRFGFSGVPTAILVDEHGAILEVGMELRGDRLLPTLERVLTERSN